jgi:hypothetical protein
MTRHVLAALVAIAGMHFQAAAVSAQEPVRPSPTPGPAAWVAGAERLPVIFVHRSHADARSFAHFAPRFSSRPHEFPFQQRER